MFDSGAPGTIGASAVDVGVTRQVDGDVAYAMNAEGDDPAVYESGTVLVSLSKGATPDQLAVELAQTPTLAGMSLEEVVTDDVVKISLPAGLAVEEATALVQAAASVEAAQPNYRYYTQGSGASATAEAVLATTAVSASSGLVAGTVFGDALGVQAAIEEPNDPHYADQWALTEMHAPEAWDEVSGQASVDPVTVAVIDSGFLVAHEDLVGNIAGMYDAANQQQTIDPTTSIASELNHGTHVAGIIGAEADNGKGVAGATRNMCKIYPIRAQDDNVTITTEYLLNAYRHLIEKKESGLNIRVVSMSIGGGFPSKVESKGSGNPFDPNLYDMINKAQDAGVVTVVAACNARGSYTPPFYAFPADYDNVVTVISLQKDANSKDGVSRASNSNYNVADQTAKNISAPGSAIWSTYATDRATDSYGTSSGTSMATPMVSSVLALMFAANPSLGVDEAIENLYATARDISDEGWDAETGHGEVDAAAAVTSVKPYRIKGASELARDDTAAFSVMLDGEVQSDWEWSSSDETIVTVSASGEVVARAAGSAVVSATKNRRTLEKTVVVASGKAPNEVVFDKDKLTLAYGQIGQLTASGVGAITYVSSDEAIAVVSATGEIEAKGAGVATITATASGDEVTEVGFAHATVVVTRAKNAGFKVVAKKLTAKAGKKAVFKPSEVWAVTNAAGASMPVYTKLSGSKMIDVKNTGKVIVSKTKAGAYKAKVKVVSAANERYKKASETVALKVFVR